MRYPIIKDQLPPMAVITEFHLVSRSGMVVGCFDDIELAKTRLKDFGPMTRIVQVDKHLTEVACNPLIVESAEDNVVPLKKTA